MKYIIEIEEKPLCVFDEDTQTYFPRLWRVKGFNSLVFDEEGLSRLEELNSDYINEHYGDLQDTAYKKGFEDGKAVHDKGCEGCKYANVAGTHEPCVRCSNSYGNQWTAKDDRIEVGDEIEWENVENNGGKGIVLWLADNSVNGRKLCDIMSASGSAGTWHTDEVVKTGRHFDIEKILEEMKK